MLRIVNLRKSYVADHETVEALRGISLEVPEGSFFTLLGPSGSGKSTALRCVAGLEHAHGGEIWIGDQCVFSAERGVMVPPDVRPIGMVFQSYAIWPHMSVFENVAFPLRHGARGEHLSRADIRRRVEEALAKVQLDGYGSRAAPQLSGGQQQRVALARALVRRPKLLLLDEPLSNLDAKLREEMRIELKEITEALGITAFFVTHDQLEALAMSDTIGVIMKGELIEVGSPHDVYTNSPSRVVAGFLGVVNVIEGRVTECGADGCVTVATDSGLVRSSRAAGVTKDSAAAVIIRPEAPICTREAPADRSNVFEGTISHLSFLGGYIDGELTVGERKLKVSLNPYDRFQLGERVYVQVPEDRCQVLP
ncbi:MAG: ABC transporter ATP-binding protein [Alphaproteobacteria bacterium]